MVHYREIFSVLCFFNDTATIEIYTYLHTLSRHDGLPICYDNNFNQGSINIGNEKMLSPLSRNSFPGAGFPNDNNFAAEYQLQEATCGNACAAEHHSDHR